MVFQRVRRCSHAGQEGTGTAPSELSACVLTGELYVLLTEIPDQLSKTCQGAARGKQSQLRKASGCSEELDGFLKVLVANGGGMEGFEGGRALIRFMFSQNDWDSSGWMALRETGGREPI